MQWRKHLRAGERRTLRAYAVENNMPVSSQPYDNISVSFLSNTARFLIFSVAICNKFELLTFPGSARTYLRCGGKKLRSFVGNIHPVFSSERILKIG